MTGQTFAIGLTATFLGRKLGLISVGVYLLLGLIGLPVFSGMTGGIAVLFGPTGGYLIGFLLQTWITGWMIERTDAHYLYDCICQWTTAVFTAGSNQGNWSSLYRYLDEKTAKSISSYKLIKKAAWKKTQHSVSSMLPYFKLNRSLF